MCYLVCVVVAFGFAAVMVVDSSVERILVHRCIVLNVQLGVVVVAASHSGIVWAVGIF